MKITLGTFKDQGEELAAFLEPRVGAKPSVSGGALEVEDGSIRDGVKPRQVKTYIKRFMYMKGVKKNYRVFVAGKELTIQEIELGKKEEEEKEEKGKEAAKEAPSKEESSEAKEEPAAQKETEKAAPKKPRAKKKKTEP